ncbi:hypothetical protein M434DRAFT_64830 [Hypoxylon sp. CO27-5]|nr:hypothetical protein M434DRAFT_64830 [Hypoxylon sp. CO27-5]
MSSEEAFIQEVWGLQGTAYLVVALRYYHRISSLGWRSLASDDAIMLLATVVYTAESVMAYLVVAYWKGLANNAMTDAQRAVLSPESQEWHLRVNGSKTHVVGLLLYTTLLWLLKACWLVYYARLTDGVMHIRRVIHWGIVILAATYISSLLVAFFKCIPFNHQWQINRATIYHCMPAISTLQTVYVMIMNTLTDFYLMAIPLPVVWNSHLPWRKKLVLLVMFSGGFLEMAFGIVRCVSILTLGDIDPAQSGYWSVRESFVSFVLTNMPMIYPMFRRFIEKSRSLSRSKATSQGDSRGYKLESLSGRIEAGGKRQQTSVPGHVMWDSKDNIVDREHGTPSDGEDTSLDLPHHSTGGVSFEEENGIPPGLARSTGGVNRILITKEYTVTEESQRGSRNFSSPVL